MFASVFVNLQTMTLTRIEFCSFQNFTTQKKGVHRFGIKSPPTHAGFHLVHFIVHLIKFPLPHNTSPEKCTCALYRQQLYYTHRCVCDCVRVHTSIANNPFWGNLSTLLKTKKKKSEQFSALVLKLISACMWTFLNLSHTHKHTRQFDSFERGTLAHTSGPHSHTSA